MNKDSNVVSKSLHNLKSSLTTLSGYTQLLEKEILKKTNDESRLLDLVGKVKNACSTIETKIEEIETQIAKDQLQ